MHESMQNGNVADMMLYVNNVSFIITVCSVCVNCRCRCLRLSLVDKWELSGEF